MSEDEIILTHILQCKPIDLIINKPVLTNQQQKQFEEYQHRRRNGEPLQYILGTCNFMGLELSVNPSVLVPRPETEQMVDEAIRQCHSRASGNPLKVLDLGTGCGCIAIAIAKFCPHAKVTAVDISAKALETARANAKQHGVENRIEFVQGNMLSVIPECFSRESIFDLMISNPPYIPTTQMSHLPKDVQQEPSLALDGGEDGLVFYRNIIKYIPDLLSRDGCLMMEFGDGQAQSIRALFDPAFTIQIFNDLAGKERFLMARRH